jgi:hypothetical protein
LQPSPDGIKAWADRPHRTATLRVQQAIAFLADLVGKKPAIF